jgi:hypothetical protein
MTKGFGNSIPFTVTARDGPEETFPFVNSIGSSNPPTDRTWLARTRTSRPRECSLIDGTIQVEWAHVGILSSL